VVAQFLGFDFGLGLVCFGMLAIELFDVAGVGVCLAGGQCQRIS
jgi:hypothetical protein